MKNNNKSARTWVAIVLCIVLTAIITIAVIRPAIIFDSVPVSSALSMFIGLLIGWHIKSLIDARRIKQLSQDRDSNIAEICKLNVLLADLAKRHKELEKVAGYRRNQLNIDDMFEESTQPIDDIFDSDNDFHPEDY